MCESLGFEDVRTYIASGNVVFRSDRDASALKAALEERLGEYAGKPVGVVIRTGAEMAEVHARNPFPDAPGNWTVAIFLDRSPAPNALESVRNQGAERIELGAREIYVAYGEGMGRSRLSIPAAESGTARNMNEHRREAGRDGDGVTISGPTTGTAAARMALDHGSTESNPSRHSRSSRIRRARSASGNSW
jgi:uncharacterized protein (DUF1697 family)